MNGLLTIQAWLELVRLDFVVRRGFNAVRASVRRTPTGRVGDAAVVDVVDAVMRACVWYVRAPKCLQRSAAVVRLLRRRGVPATLVIGCHPQPLRAHAWVEVDGAVVSDALPDLKYFQVLDRW